MADKRYLNMPVTRNVLLTTACKAKARQEKKRKTGLEMAITKKYLIVNISC